MWPTISRARSSAGAISTLTVVACLLASSAADAKTCPLKGDAHQALAKELNVYKNRRSAPPVSAFNPQATLAALLAPGDDLHRWSRHDAALLEGVIVKVKPGGQESANCHAKALDQRDTHIEIALDSSAPASQHVIVEITPQWRSKMKPLNWSPEGVRAALVPGRRIIVAGWLFDDLEHVNAAENTHPGGVHNWRATVWEIHPVTGFTVLQ